MTGRWSVLAGSATGSAHARSAVGCQDAYAVAEVAGCLLVAVADGASSAPLAALGATLASTLAIRTAADLLADGGPDDEPGWRALLDRVLTASVASFSTAITALAPARRGDVAVPGPGQPHDAATTLTVVLARPPWIAAGTIGDGFVVVRTGAGVGLLLAPPGGPARPPGGTDFVTSPRAVASARRCATAVPGLSGVAVSSDGLDTLLLEYVGAEPRGPASEPYATLFGWAGDRDGDEMRLVRLLASERVCRLTEDDKTLVVAVPRDR